MDCQMPRKDGYEATRQIRKMEAGSAHRAWIIAMTANAMVGDRERCIEAGMDDYLSKPVRSEELVAVLERFVALRDRETGAVSWKDATSSEALDGLREIQDEVGQSVLPGLIRIFLANTPPAIASIHTAIASGELSDIAKNAHMLKGSCSNFGANRMRDVCERLESAAISWSVDQTKELVAELEREFHFVRIALEHELGGVHA